MTLTPTRPTENFIVIRGTRETLEDLDLADRVEIERVSVSDRRLWEYQKLTIKPPESVRDIQLILEEYMVPIMCVNCPNYVQICLVDARAREERDKK